jgi:hypothetical protein
MKRFKYTNVYVDSEVDTMKYATKEEEARFTNIARKVGFKHGFEHVSVDIQDFQEFKVQWTRSYKSCSFRMSDYMCGAPDGVVEDLFETLFQKFEGNDAGGYSARMNEYITDSHFAGQHRKTYLSRKGAENKRFTVFKGTPVYFSKNPLANGKVSGSSVLMNVIILNPKYRNESEEFIESAIRREYNNRQSCLDRFGKVGKCVDYNEAILRGLP